MDKETGSVFEPLRPQRLPEEVFLRVKRAILDGHYKPGDRLPSQQELCETFGVGKPVVREALRSLENSGLISVRQGGGGGAFVQKIDASTLVRTFEGIVKMDNISLEELSEARLALEMGALPLVFERLQAEDLEQLRQNLEDARDNLERRLRGKKNLNFHVLLLKASKNPLLFKIAEALYELMSQLIEKYEYSEERSRRAFLIHQRLIELLEAREFTKVEDLLESHIKDSKTLFTTQQVPEQST
jgi:GntR family transcriptional repressor for pyruvate dehydrogenase complex